MFTSIAVICALLISKYLICNVCHAQNVTLHQQQAAGENGNEKKIDKLIQNGANVNDNENQQKLTPLHRAARAGNNKAVEALISQGADVNSKDIDLWTPLFYASTKTGMRYEEVIETLLKNGANVDAKDTDLWTPLFYASRNSADGSDKIVEILLRNGADPNAADTDLWTPLFYASRKGLWTVVEKLLKNGGDVNAADVWNWTSIFYSARIGHVNVTNLLLIYGANINIIDEDRWTPLFNAVSRGRKEIVEILLRNAADVHAKDINKNTPLHVAVEFGHEAVAQLLILNGANVNAQNNKKWSPLHVAAYQLNDREDIIDLLIMEGTSIKAKDSEGKSALDIAISRGNRKIIELLRNKTQERAAERACQRYLRLPVGYVLNGDPVESSECPWMAALGYFNYDAGYQISFDCGGTVISDRFIMTTAHCVKPSRTPVVVRLGKRNLDDDDGVQAANHEIKQIIQHPDYSTITEKNDIALIRLKNQIDFSDSVSPACLQTDLRDELPETKLIVTGWGTTSVERKKKSNQLLKTQLKTMPFNECNETLTFFNMLANLPAFRDGISESQYCAYDPQGHNDSCQGDSGGPLQIFNESNAGVATVVGIVSFGISCGLELPGIYTRVAHYLDWIEPIVWPNL